MADNNATATTKAPKSATEMLGEINDENKMNASIAAKRAIEIAKTAAAAPRQPTPNEKAEADADASNNKLSAKHRSVRGVPEGFSTTWIPFDVSHEDAARVAKVAKARGVKVVDVYIGIIKDALKREDVKSVLDADAAKAPESKASSTSLNGKSPEQLEAAATKAQEQLAKLQAKLKELREKSAANSAK